MTWRCTWCGKPHAENEPPCDNCGHNVFEEAVVRADDGADADDGTIETGPSYVWRCQQCGRDHVKNRPPCSRCGHPHLERTEQDYSDVDRDLQTPSWFAVAKPYLPAIVIVAAVVGLFASGLVSPSILPGIGAPSPPDAPGDGTTAAGLDLETTERAVHDQLEADRADSRSLDDGLGAFTIYQHRALIALQYDDVDPDPTDPNEFGVECTEEITGGQQLLTDLELDGYADEAALAAAVATELSTSFAAVDGGDRQSEAIDLHLTPDDELSVLYLTC